MIDAKWLKGRVEVRRDGGILRPRRERLFVAGRDKSKLVEGLLRQVAAVREACPAADMRGAFCFADVEGLPLVGRSRARGRRRCAPTVWRARRPHARRRRPRWRVGGGGERRRVRSARGAISRCRLGAARATRARSSGSPARVGEGAVVLGRGSSPSSSTSMKGPIGDDA